MSLLRYIVFTRTWWRDNPDWPNGLEPWPGERSTITKVRSRGEAVAICKEYNATHEPGRLSLKAEFDSLEVSR
jgi:hypothetical protein